MKKKITYSHLDDILEIEREVAIEEEREYKKEQAQIRRRERREKARENASVAAE